MAKKKPAPKKVPLPKFRKAHLNIEDLQIDPKYQRTLSKRRARWIAENFYPEAFGVLHVGQRANGSYWVVDGGHRLEAARLMGHAKVPCKVFESTGAAHEARVYRIINQQRRRTSSIDAFKALLAEGDLGAVALNRIVEKHGLRIPQSHGTGSTNWPNVSSVAALQKAFVRGGPKCVDETLGILTGAWRQVPGGNRGDMIEGVSLLLVECPNINRERLVEKLRGSTPVSVRAVAEPTRLTYGSRERAIAEAILIVYNKKLKHKLSLRK